MNTLHSRNFFIIAMALLIVSSALAATEKQSKNVIEKEQNLVNNVEMQKGDTQSEPSSFWDKMASIYKKNESKQTVDADLDLNSKTKEIGETDGFWTRIKKAFAYSTQPKRRSSKRDIEINVLMIEAESFYNNHIQDKFFKAYIKYLQITKNKEALQRMKLD